VESIVLCPPGAKDCPEGYLIRFLHGWARRARHETLIEYPSRASCREQLPHQHLADGIAYAVGIGLFVTHGPAEPKGADERPETVVCDGRAHTLW
jgi:hypothetical protein